MTKKQHLSSGVRSRNHFIHPNYDDGDDDGDETNGTNLKNSTPFNVAESNGQYLMSNEDLVLKTQAFVYDHKTYTQKNPDPVNA